MDSLSKDSYFLPGESVGRVEDLKKKLNLEKLKVGPGLMIKNGHLVTTVAGFLSISPSSVLWMLNNPRVYLPKLNDTVIAKVVKIRGDRYKVDLGSNTVAFLPVLAFTNATKKVRPDLTVGDLVYAKVCRVNPNIDFEITCQDPSAKNCKLGPLSSNNSYLIRIDIYLAQRLVMKNTSLSQFLKNELPPDCDIVVGINGLVYISAPTTDLTMRIVKIFKDFPKH
ncbi:putative exosome complex component rrp40 [Thelohanellus kitauei]|uniref:Putative exosome complex component rrp40 n=1 Tax=Thelohanellus kitauei TaxID=669202 RepID=A0A0C2IYH5_THEKT|nr:putative exosome complex component rrp40 [Thelohanellus kitauei]